MSITNIKRNRMGTINFDGRFNGMRKAQSFIVYPIGKDGDPTRIKIQSDTRIGFVDLTNGEAYLTPSISSGAHSGHLTLAKSAGTLSAEELLLVKANVMASAHGHAGTNGIMYTDNSGALEVFAGQGACHG